MQRESTKSHVKMFYKPNRLQTPSERSTKSAGKPARTPAMPEMTFGAIWCGPVSSGGKLRAFTRVCRGGKGHSQRRALHRHQRASQPIEYPLGFFAQEPIPPLPYRPPCSSQMTRLAGAFGLVRRGNLLMRAKCVNAILLP